MEGERYAKIVHICSYLFLEIGETHALACFFGFRSMNPITIWMYVCDGEQIDSGISIH